MRSSRAYVADKLDLPAVTFADRAGMMLVVFAAGFGAYAALRQGWQGAAAVSALAGLAVAGAQAWCWTKSRKAAGRWLESAPGSLALCSAGGPALPARLHPATRLLGGSVFIDAGSAVATVNWRLRRWITPFDVPPEVLRRWRILLLARKRVANRDGSPVAVA